MSSVPKATDLLARYMQARPPGPPPPEPPPPPATSIPEALARQPPDVNALAAYLSDWARLVYEPAWCDTVAGREGAANARSFPKGAMFAFAFTRDGHAWIVFRGTKKWHEFLYPDLMIVPGSWPLRHLGFLEYWRRAQTDIRAWLDGLPPESRSGGLILTGHSLGGALAKLAAFDLAGVFPIRAVVTFGSPRAGLLRFASLYDARPCGQGTLGSVTMRFTHRTDLISRIPPPLLYSHVGCERVVHDNGRLEDGRPPTMGARYLAWRETWLWRIKAWAEPLASRPGTTVTPTPGAVRPVTPQELHVMQRSLARSSEPDLVLRFVRLIQVVALLSVALAGLIAGLAVIAWVRVTMRDGMDHFCAKYAQAFRNGYPALWTGIDEVRKGAGTAPPRVRL